MDNQYHAHEALNVLYRLSFFENSAQYADWISKSKEKTIDKFIKLRINLETIKKVLSLSVKKLKPEGYPFIILGKDKYYCAWNLSSRMHNWVNSAFSRHTVNLQKENKQKKEERIRNIYFGLLYEFYTVFEEGRLQAISEKMRKDVTLTQWLDGMDTIYKKYPSVEKTMASLLDDKYIDYKSDKDVKELLQWMKTAVKANVGKGLCFNLFDQLLSKIIKKGILKDKTDDLIDNVIMPLKNRIYHELTTHPGSREIKDYGDRTLSNMLLSVDKKRRDILSLDKNNFECIIEQILSNFVLHKKNTALIKPLKNAINDKEDTKKAILQFLTYRFTKNNTTNAKKDLNNFLNMSILDPKVPLWQSLFSSDDKNQLDHLIEKIAYSSTKFREEFKQYKTQHAKTQPQIIPKSKVEIPELLEFIPEIEVSKPDFQVQIPNLPEVQVIEPNETPKSDSEKSETSNSEEPDKKKKGDSNTFVWISVSIAVILVMGLIVLIKKREKKNFSSEE
ncbi:MAG: hypothetical protein AAF335_00790 [Bacteroidota bacterium]